MRWENSALSSATIQSLNGGTCTVRTGVPVSVEGVKGRSRKTNGGYVIRFETQKGKLYHIHI